MRRSEREITARSELDAILSEAHFINLAMVDQGRPYVVPMNFGYADGYLYVHSAAAGRKVEILKRAPDISFSVIDRANVIPGPTACQFTTHYRSVLGSGHVERVDDPAEKARGLDSIMRKSAEGPFAYDERALLRTLIFRIRIEQVSGKQSGD